MKLSGCGTALLTPFTSTGALDEAALTTHVQAQVAAGIELLIPCGTTGEAATLTEAEWLRVIELTIAAAGTVPVSGGRPSVFAGCTHNSTAVAVARARQLSQLPGLTGILTANPYYNRPGQPGQYAHFLAIADASTLPVMLYNIPGRTGANLEPATVLRLAEHKNIVAIKESSGNILQITELLTLLQREAPADFAVFAGDDALALPILALGGAGLISVASNIIPAQMTDLVRAALQNNYPAARRLNARLYPLMQALFTEPSPAPVKAAHALLTGQPEHLRLPMLPVTESTRALLRNLLQSLA